MRDAVLAEMERTGAFERAAILVVTTTGSGWVNEWNASAFEYLGGGDTAIAAMQYSTLPSALALLSAQSEPPAAGTLLFDAIEHRLASMPADHRPKLYVSGESLGAFGSTAAFSSADDLLRRVDGAVWTGTPEFTPLHQAVTATREGGSTQVNPVVDNGRHFRFTGSPNELVADQFGRELGTWSYPRVVFVQHPTDPVVWWSPRLISQTPDWLVETRTAGPMEQMGWLPFVTFWQVSADLAVANSVPDGFGHQYHSELVPTWAAVLGKDPSGGLLEGHLVDWHLGEPGRRPRGRRRRARGVAGPAHRGAAALSGGRRPAPLMRRVFGCGPTSARNCPERCPTPPQCG